MGYELGHRRPVKSRFQIVSLAFVFAIALFGCKRSPIGGKCSAALDCAPGAERCLKGVTGNDGVCTKQCTADAECGALATCQRVSLTSTGGVHGSDVHESVESYCMPKK